VRDCPFCRGPLEDLPALDPELLLLVVANNPGWRPDTGLCTRCRDEFATAFAQARAHHPPTSGSRDAA
jgi:hypothetical protein